jgi:hypothetical protein
MSVFLALLSRAWPYLACVALVLAGVAYIDHRGYERAQADEAKREAAFAKVVADAVADIDRKTAERIASIDTTQRTVVQPIIAKEIAGDPRYSDPACSLTDGMRDAINRARAASGAAGGSGAPVSGSSSAR